MQQASLTIAILENGGVEILTDHGELLHHNYESARKFLTSIQNPILVIHARSLFSKLNMRPIAHFELLELFAFTHPAEFCVPTLSGLEEFLQLEPKGTASIFIIIETLLTELSQKTNNYSYFLTLAIAMQSAGWNWGNHVVDALQINPLSAKTKKLSNPYAVWETLDEWQDGAPPTPAGDEEVTPSESQERLAALLGESAEMRHSQYDYCSAVTKSFTPKHSPDIPNIVLAEGGTGIGKTYAYLAPATLWSEKNDAPVWVSTFTRNLQHQISNSLRESYPKEQANERIIIRKGRENYLCLLNYANLAKNNTIHKQTSVPLALIALWIMHTPDGDLNSDKFPAWLADICSRQFSTELADKKGECIFSACQYYKKCFIENSIRKAKFADIVIANHALVIENFYRQVKQAQNDENPPEIPLRCIFDEGHHLFNCADSAFSSQISANSMNEMKKWIIGDGKNNLTQQKGIQARLKGITIDDAQHIIDDIIQSTNSTLPTNQWLSEPSDIFNNNNNNQTEKLSPANQLLKNIFLITSARSSQNQNKGEYYGQEYAPPKYQNHTEAHQDSMFHNIQLNAQEFSAQLHHLRDTIILLQIQLRKYLSNNNSANNDNKNRIRQTLNTLQIKCLDTINSWIEMLDNINSYEQNLNQNNTSYHWFAIIRFKGKIKDIGYFRNYIDPMQIFSQNILKNIHGCVITSATLTDDASSQESWKRAYQYNGINTLQSNNYNPKSISHHRVSSPFNYQKQASIIVINDVNPQSSQQSADAMSQLFKAANGGAIGIFTAIKNLQEAHPIITQNMLEKNIPLYAQHIDQYHLQDLISIFKHQQNSCLIGTNALRDGIDIPGEALRLVVFDKVPWQRRSLLLKERLKSFGKEYDEMLARLALRQAFGRLIRSQNDKGVFVILDKRLPTRLQSAFPQNARLIKCSLNEAQNNIKQFLNT